MWACLSCCCHHLMSPPGLEVQDSHLQEEGGCDLQSWKSRGAESPLFPLLGSHCAESVSEHFLHVNHPLFV